MASFFENRLDGRQLPYFFAFENSVGFFDEVDMFVFGFDVVDVGIGIVFDDLLNMVGNGAWGQVTLFADLFYRLTFIK